MKQVTAGSIPSFADIVAATRRIVGTVRMTPVLAEPAANEALGCELWLKCKNLQRAGAFKFRGASNAVARLSEAGRLGDLATHSFGNHGAALALAAANHGRRAWIVMPENSVKAKIELVRRYGGQVIFCKPTLEGREEGLDRLLKKGCIPVHLYDYADIICEQGTATVEFIRRNVNEVLTVSETGIIEAMAFTWLHFRLLIEPSSATVIAAIREHRSHFEGRRVGIIVCGGNVESIHLPFFS